MNIETLRLLVAKGLSAVDILQVAETMDSPVGRSTGAARQARYRARKAQENVTSDVTRDVTSDDNALTVDPALSLPPNENKSNPPTHTHPEPKSRARKAVRAEMLGEGWEPAVFKAGTVSAAIVAAWQPGRIERELSKFRDHHRAKGNRMVDWDAAWRTWIGNADEFGNRNGRGHRAGDDSPHGPSTRAALGFLEDLDRSDAGNA